MSRGIGYLTGVGLTVAGIVQAVVTMNPDGLTLLLCASGLTVVCLAKVTEPEEVE